MKTANPTDEPLQRFRVDLDVAPVDTALHRVLAACHRRRLTIDSLHYRRSTTADRIVMDVLMAAGRAAFIVAVLQREPLVIRCTATPAEPAPASM
jgi:acetolactate synthase regulatory subunit